MQTVEVLACVLAHRAPSPRTAIPLSRRVAELPKNSCIACVACNTHADDPDDSAAQRYTGTWVECSGCHAWMHGECIGATAAGADDTVLCAACMRDLCLQEVPHVSKATLIVCPPAIHQQWFDEIQRHAHAGHLKVVTYAGQKANLLTSRQGARPPRHPPSRLPIAKLQHQEVQIACART